MKQIKSVESWARKPLGDFVRESASRLSLLMTTSGQVVAQYGFVRAVDVMAAAALGAGITASTNEMAKLVGERRFSALNHQGREHRVFLAPLESRRGTLILLTVYGIESSLGLVQLFFEEFADAVAEACPEPETQKPVLAANFERELDDNLRALFGS